MAAKVTYRDESKRVLKAASKGNAQSLSRAAFMIRRAVQALFKKSSVPSSPGQPPHTRRGKIKRSILYDVDKNRQVAVIGPSAALISQSAAAHEFGGRYKKQLYPARPFMGPGLEETAPRLGSQWQGSVRE